MTTTDPKKCQPRLPPAFPADGMAADMCTYYNPSAFYNTMDARWFRAAHARFACTVLVGCDQLSGGLCE